MYIWIMKATTLKRNPHSYKCIDKVYKKANLQVRKRYSKESNITLATLVERFVTAFSEGDIITASKSTDGGIKHIF